MTSTADMKKRVVILQLVSRSGFGSGKNDWCLIVVH